jgi:hypothetical protein
LAALRNFEPTVKWVDENGFLTERAKGFLRSLFDFTGATAGTVPVGSLGGDGVSGTLFLSALGTWDLPDYPIGANPTVSAGLTANDGIATTFMRSDASPAIDQGITPTWTGAHVFSSSVKTGAFGANNATPQTSASIGAAVATTAATQTTPYGYATQAQADDIVARINTIRAALVANGILT